MKERPASQDGSCVVAWLQSGLTLVKSGY